jgi:putative SOS response-associated peptidase YedK
MCNLYAVTKGQQAIREAARAMQDRLGNLPPLPAIFPDMLAPIVRANGADRELVMARWGFPPPPPRPGSKPSTRPVTNVRNTDSRHWTPWLKKPEHRCLVPVTSFSEPDNRGGDKAPSIWTWFAKDETRPVMFFAGIWRDWEGTRGTKAHPADGQHLLYSFLTSEASADVREIHPDATPVILLSQEEQEAWLNAPWEIARDLQKPPRAGALRIVAFNTKKDEG